MAVMRRVNIVKQFMAGRRNGEGWWGLAQNVLVYTAEMRMKDFGMIGPDRLVQDGLRPVTIYAPGGQVRLWVPTSMSAHRISQVVAEALVPYNWHQYITPETPITPEDIVVDCGASDGLFAVLAVTAHRAKHVFAVEPMLDFQRGIERTLANPEIRGLADRFTILPYAVGDRNGQAFFTDRDIASHLSDTPTNLPVKIVTLDHLYATRPDFRPTYIKADIEGAEPAMIRGAANLIADLRPKIAITTYHTPQGQAREIADEIRRICPTYTFRFKGVEPSAGQPTMLHAYHL